MAREGQLIILMFVVLAFLVVSYIFYLWIEYQSPNNVITDDAGSSIMCPANQCAVSLTTGNKRCPYDGEMITRGPGDVCSLPFSCSNPNAPYALWNDGSVDFQGNCPEGLACDCLTAPRCPSYITSSWVQVTGDPAVRGIGGRPLMQQNSPPSNQLEANEYCTVPYNWLIFGTPGCPALSSTVSYDDIQFCMNIEKQNISPCLNGVLAYVPETPDDFNPARYEQTPLGCVVGTTDACADDQVRVWDNYTATIVCRSRI